jgi:lysophospholipid acyltransferase (LPLAT)-like uncharacterized protein
MMASPSKSRGLVSRIKNDKSFTWFWNIIAPPFAIISASMLNFAMKTSTVRVVNHRESCGNKIFKPAIYICWHQHLPLTMHNLGLDSDNNNTQSRKTILMQSNPYMNTIAAFTERIGVNVLRGGGKDDDNVKAVQVMKQLLEDGHDILLAVDGPSGPIYKVKRGCIDLARDVGVPIIHVSYTCVKGIVLESRWDKMLYPNLFDRITIHYGKPLYIPKHEDAETSKQRINQAYLDLDISNWQK